MDITYPNKNTGDQFTATEANEIKTAVNTKVDKVAGKGLSANDYTADDANKVANLPDDTNGALADKVDKVGTKQLTDENYTSAEKSKLAGLSVTYVGTYLTLTALQTAHATGQAGWEAIIDGGVGIDPQKAFWDTSDNAWKLQTGGGASSFSELGGSPNDNTALAAALANKAALTHGHAIAEVTGLQTALDATVKTAGDQTVAGVKEFTSGIRAFRTAREEAGTTYTLQLSDRGQFLVPTSSSAVAITIPPNSSVAFALDTEIEICRGGAGEVTIVAGAGVTILSSGNRLRIAEQHGAVVLKKRGTDTWRLIGGTKT